MKRVLLLLSFLSFSLAANAKPVLDQAVKNFLTQDSTKADSKLRVILLFQSAQIPEFPHQSQYHAEIEKALIAQTQRQQEVVFSQSVLKGAVLTAPLWIANASVVTLNKSQLLTLTESKDLSAIHFAERKIRLVSSAPVQINANEDKFTYGLQKLQIPQLRAKYPNLLGKGIRVGVLDTGIDTTHPDMKGRLAVYKNFSPAQSQKPEDGFGHGTHVSGTIAGGSSSGLSIGIAPEASLIVGRIFDDSGESTEEGILRAMQWVADPDGNPNTNDFAQVVNNSWGDDQPFTDREPEADSFCNVINNWVKLGMIPVFSAGNSGPNPGTSNVPGACPKAVAVGATEQYDRSPSFSSVGPAMWKVSRIVKPDISAPGVDVISASISGDYEKMSGTSMAAPHITGAFALLLQAKPGLTVEAATQAIYKGSKDLGDSGKDNDFGWGRADLLNSVQLLQFN